MRATSYEDLSTPHGRTALTQVLTVMIFYIVKDGLRAAAARGRKGGIA